MSNARILHKHRLGYFPELKVGEDIFAMRYASGCSMSNCHGICCADGVDVDIAERDRILEHADMIRQYMDETQDRDTANWFQEPKADPDFPSGQCTTTRLKSNGCNFLNKHGQCVVHMAEVEGPAGIRISEAVFLPGLSGVHPQRHALRRRRAMSRREGVLRPREERAVVDPRHVRLRAGIHARHRGVRRASARWRPRGRRTLRIKTSDKDPVPA